MSSSFCIMFVIIFYRYEYFELWRHTTFNTKREQDENVPRKWFFTIKKNIARNIALHAASRSSRVVVRGHDTGYDGNTVAVPDQVSVIPVQCIDVSRLFFRPERFVVRDHGSCIPSIREIVCPSEVIVLFEIVRG